MKLHELGLQYEHSVLSVREVVVSFSPLDAWRGGHTVNNSTPITVVPEYACKRNRRLQRLRQKKTIEEARRRETGDPSPHTLAEPGWWCVECSTMRTLSGDDWEIALFRP